MNKKESFIYFDQIEQKIVFRVSRTFFWIFVAIAGLTFVASIFILLYSIIPPVKEKVVKEQYPEKPKVTLEEILLAVTPPPKYEEEKPQVTQLYEETEEGHDEPVAKYEKKVDSLELKIKSLLDSLGTFIKSGWGITYENYIIGYDWFGRPYYGTRAKRGLKSDLENLLNENFELKTERIKMLEFLIDVMHTVGEGKREKALKVFIQLTKDKWNDYRRTINRIESDYNMRVELANAKYTNAKLEKRDLGNKALISLGGAIVLMALVGLVLSFLAIERNTRAVKELLEREKK